VIGDDAGETVIRLTGAPDRELGVGLGLNAWAGYGQDGEIDPGLIHRLQPAALTTLCSSLAREARSRPIL
jgi:hypothetical protein